MNKTLAIVLAIGCAHAVLPGLTPAADAPIAPEDIVVAERDGVKVTLAEVDAQVMLLPKHLRPSYLDDPERIEQVVGGLLVNKQMARKAAEWGVESDPYFQAQLQAARDDLMAKRATALNEDQLRANMPDFEQLAEEIYLTHPHRFNRPVTLDLEHILVSTRGRSKDAAMERVQSAREALLAGDRPFEEIFNEFSDEALDPRRLSVGILNDVIPGTTEKPFEEAVFKLTKVGEISPIIETIYGYHVVRLLGRKEPTKQSFEEVKPHLMMEQMNNYTQQGKSNFVSTFLKHELKAHPMVVAQLRSRYAKADQGLLAPALDGSEDEADEAGSDASMAADPAPVTE
jgi:hypothetical protein